MDLLGIDHLRHKRLGITVSDSDFFKKHPMYNERVLSGLQSLLLQMGVLPNESFSEDEYHVTDLVAIRCNDIDAFEAFCMLCLRHAVGSCSWKKEHRKTKCSKIFTLCDEAFAFLVLENNRLIWKSFYDRIQDDEKLVAETKFTVRGSMGGLKGWHKDGIKLFNELLREVEQTRHLNQSKIVEENLQRQWNEDRKNVLKTAGRIVVDDDNSESEEDVEPLIIDF